jgi:inorganic pyrophosphatase
LISAEGAYWFPLTVTAAGILVSILTTLIAPLITVDEKTVERNLKIQLIISTVLMSILMYFFSTTFLPSSFKFAGVDGLVVTPMKAYGCVMFGLWSGLIIGIVTEYYTSNAFTPVKKLAEACVNGGAATNVIAGLALGYMSTIVPIICLGITIYFSFVFANMYGIALAALGMLGCLPIALAIDGYGPISDNAGGIAELCELPKNVRRTTDILDAAGNTTAAIGKGFAIGSACLVALALFGAFVTRTGQTSVNILAPI